MNRFLQYFNLAGILALALLCAIQWRTNRNANLEVIRLEKISLKQATTLAEKERTLKGSTADLDSFRQQVKQSETETINLKSNLFSVLSEKQQIMAERDGLKLAVHDWAAAVSNRDARLRSVNAQIEKLSVDRNQTVQKFNELADKYNSMVTNLNETRARTTATPSLDTKR